MTRLQIVAAMEAARKNRLCGYMGDTCDCKYGIGENVERAREEAKAGRLYCFSSSEQTGCPEMRTAIAILRNMTDQEWDKIQRRMARNAKAAFLKYSKQPRKDLLLSNLDQLKNEISKQ